MKLKPEKSYKQFYKSHLKSVVVLYLLLSTGVAHAELRERPDYLNQATFAMFMANEVVKYCKELVPDEKTYIQFQKSLSERLAKDGITNVREQVKPMSLDTMLQLGSAEMEKNGGPFMFNPEKYCEYGRNEIKQKSDIGILLKEAN